MNLEKCRDAYLNDADFHHFIDCLRGFIRELNFTPSEMRQAIVSAAYLEEMQTIRPMTIIK